MLRPGALRQPRIALLGLALAVGCGLSSCNTAAEDPALRLLQARCGRCPPFDNALSKQKSADGWSRTVWAMRQRGARLSDQEAALLIRYLVRKQGLP